MNGTVETTARASAEPVPGETRRVVAIACHRVGDEGIVTFRDRDRPGEVYRAFVCSNMVPDGLALGERCTLRYRREWRLRGGLIPAGWNFIGLDIE